MNEKLVMFLYLLMRDELPTGAVERKIAQAEINQVPLYSAVYLENYARQLADRLSQ